MTHSGRAAAKNISPVFSSTISIMLDSKKSTRLENRAGSGKISWDSNLALSGEIILEIVAAFQIRKADGFSKGTKTGKRIFFPRVQLH